jgi:hypothetical protein
MKKPIEKKEKTERDLLSEVSEKLDKVIALLAINGKEQDEQIAILRSFGHDWTFIGTIIGLKPDAARMRYSSHQKPKTKAKA